MSVLYVQGATYLVQASDCVNLQLIRNAFYCVNCGHRVGVKSGLLFRFINFVIIEPKILYPRTRLICKSWNCTRENCARFRLGATLYGRHCFKIPKKSLLLRMLNLPSNILTFQDRSSIINCEKNDNCEIVEYCLTKNIIDSGLYDIPNNIPAPTNAISTTEPFYDTISDAVEHQVAYDIPRRVPFSPMVQLIDANTQVENQTIEDINDNTSVIIYSATIFSPPQEEINDDLINQIEMNQHSINQIEMNQNDVVDLISPCSSSCSTPRLVICESPSHVIERDLSEMGLLSLDTVNNESSVPLLQQHDETAGPSKQSNESLQKELLHTLEGIYHVFSINIVVIYLYVYCMSVFPSFLSKMNQLY